MKLSLIYFLLFCVCHNGKGQDDNKVLKSGNCDHDSIDYFLSELDSLGINRVIHLDTVIKLKTYKISDTALHKLKSGDSCSFALYVAVFNRLILNGLDLQFDYVKNQPYRVSVMGPANEDLSSAYIQRDIIIEKLRTYKNFLSLKKYYEEYIIKGRVFKRDNYSYRKMIDSIIMHGNFTNPEFLRKILLSKYKHLTEAKLERQQRRYILDHILN